MLIQLPRVEAYIMLYKANQMVKINFLGRGDINYNPKFKEQITLFFILLTLGQFV